MLVLSMLVTVALVLGFSRGTADGLPVRAVLQGEGFYNASPPTLDYHRLPDRPLLQQIGFSLGRAPHLAPVSLRYVAWERIQSLYLYFPGQRELLLSLEWHFPLKPRSTGPFRVGVVIMRSRFGQPVVLKSWFLYHLVRYGWSQPRGSIPGGPGGGANAHKKTLR